MSKIKYKEFMADFETTSYDGQEYTEVWAAALQEIGKKEEPLVFTSIVDFYEHLKSLRESIVVYFHNLKFDGSFILDYLLIQKGYKSSIENENDIIEKQRFNKKKSMKKGEVVYSISSMGLWYRIIVCEGRQFIEFRDSLKLLPFSVTDIASSFTTLSSKGVIEYKGFREAGNPLTKSEVEYVKGDVKIVSEALGFIKEKGLNKLTIGSSALSYYKCLLGPLAYNDYFPNLYEYELDYEKFGAANIGDYIRNSYRGGWTYLVKGKEEKKYHNGITLDVNSLYPYVMHSSSGFKYPIREPKFWKGSIPEIAKDNKYLYFVRFECKFRIKENHLPFIQIKNNLMYKGTEMLETSDIFSKQAGRYFDKYVGLDGKVHEAKVVLTMNEIEYKLFHTYYDVIDEKILDGCYFETAIGLFDEYIDYWIKIKKESKGSLRTLAKLMLNSLYGKFAASVDSSFKVAKIIDGSIKFFTINANDKVPGYIPIGACITSFARYTTITAAQANYYGREKPGFIYADTDSLHMDLSCDKLRNVKIDDKELGKWKLENHWKIGFFTRAKCYIETQEEESACVGCTKSLDQCEKCFAITCAGMPKQSKSLLRMSITQNKKEQSNKDWNDYINEKRNIEDFRVGLEVPGKLRPVRIPGGVVLEEVYFTFRKI